MTKQFNLLQLFSLVDGRLSTSMNDVYTMLNHICDADLMPHNLSKALEYTKKNNPTWFKKVNERLKSIKVLCQSNDFDIIIEYIKNNANDVYDIPQLKDEFDTSDFISFMVGK